MILRDSRPQNLYKLINISKVKLVIIQNNVKREDKTSVMEKKAKEMSDANHGGTNIVQKY